MCLAFRQHVSDGIKIASINVFVENRSYGAGSRLERCGRVDLVGGAGFNSSVNIFGDELWPKQCGHTFLLQRNGFLKSYL